MKPTDDTIAEALVEFSEAMTKLRSSRGRKVYPRVTKRPDLAGTFGYDLKGNYIGKPWSKCW